MKIAAWNVNGLRAVGKKGFNQWFESFGADLLCLQEIKALREQVDEDLNHPLGFHSFWNSAEKPGYSGTLVYCKKEPLRDLGGLGIEEFDREGRVQTLEFSNFYLINAYFPNSQREHTRLPYKLKFCKAMQSHCDKLKKKKAIILCGDFNVAHKEIDLKNPKSNVKNAGFLPEEREWMTEFLDSGYIDTFRKYNQNPDQYTWWSNRPGVREKNIGWRLDYFVINREGQDLLKNSEIHPHVKGSDHCPVSVMISD